MRLDLITERSQTAEVNWLESSSHTCLGITMLAGRQYRIKLVKGRFGGGISIYPHPVTIEEFNIGKSLSEPLALPDALLPFVGSTFTVEGARGGILKTQAQAIELLDEIPAEGEGTSWREALYRKLEKQETIGIFAALGFTLDPDGFEDYEALAKAREEARQAEAAS